MTMDDWQALVAARLVPGTSASTHLPALVRQLRRRTAGEALGGGLLFDGERIVVLLVGALMSVARVLDELTAAPQIAGPVESLVEGPVGPATAHTGWVAGYTEPELIDRLQQGDGDAAALTAAFRAALGANFAQ